MVRKTWICIAPCRDHTSTRSGMARILKWFHSFTCTPRVHPLTEWTYLPTHSLLIISSLPNKFIGTSGKPMENGILFFVDPYGCVRLLIQIRLTLTTLYPSKISLWLIWSICSAFFHFALFILINRSDIFERYNVVSDRTIWVNKQTHPYRSTKTNKILYSAGSPEVPMN